MKNAPDITRRAVVLGAMSLAAAGLALPTHGQSANLSGIYRVEGGNPDSTVYDGRAVIGQQGNAVQINWTVGHDAYAGSDILEGGVVVINRGQPQPVIYVVMPNGALHGAWNDGTAPERLLPL